MQLLAIPTLDFKPAMEVGRASEVEELYRRSVNSSWNYL